MTEASFQPFSLGSYVCQAVLGSSLTGELYLAVHLPSGNRRAIRQLGLDLQQATQQIQALLKAQLRVQQLSHPHIVAVREVLRQEEQLYVVRDYVPGVSLKRLFEVLARTGPLPPAVAGFIIWQICQALYHAHHLPEQGRTSPLLHGALWPSNVLITAGGEVSLTDFRGGANLSALEDSYHRRYLGPEQRGSAPASCRSDLYAVGLLLFELLSGAPFFAGPNAAPSADHLTLSLRRIEPSLQHILGRCLQPVPGDRYDDLAALISELSIGLSGLGDARTRGYLAAFIASQLALEDEEDTDAIPRPKPLPGFAGGDITEVTPADLADLLREVSRHSSRANPALERRSLPLAEPLEEDESEATIVDCEPPVLAATSLRGGSALEDQGEGPTEVMPASALGTPELTDEETTKTEPRPPAALFPPPQLEDAPALPSPLPGRLAAPLALPHLAPLDSLVESDLSTEIDPPDTTPGTANKHVPAGWSLPLPPPPSPPSPPDKPRTRSLTLPPLDDTAASSSFNDLTAQESPRALNVPLRRPLGNEDQPAIAPGATHPVFSRPLSSLPLPSELPPEHVVRPAKPLRPPPPPVILPDSPNGSCGEASSFSVNYDGQSLSVAPAKPPRLRRYRLSGAHALLIVAIILFLFALSLLVRRIILTRSPSAAKMAVQLNAAEPAHSRTTAASSAEANTRRDKQVVLATASEGGELPVPAAANAAAAPRPAATDARTPPVDSSQAVPAQPPAELQAGQLLITSAPPGAIYVNHKLVGPAPATIRLPPGQAAKVQVAAPGHMLYETVLELPADRGLRLQAQLRPASYPRAENRPRGVLAVRCREKDPRRVRINGQDTGYSCPKVTFLLKPGRYAIGIYSLTRDKVWTFRTQVRSGKRTLLRVPPPR